MFRGFKWKGKDWGFDCSTLDVYQLSFQHQPKSVTYLREIVSTMPCILMVYLYFWMIELNWSISNMLHRLKMLESSSLPAWPWPFIHFVLDKVISSAANTTFLFDKVVSATDCRSTGHFVLPKRKVEVSPLKYYIIYYLKWLYVYFWRYLCCMIDKLITVVIKLRIRNIFPHFPSPGASGWHL